MWHTLTRFTVSLILIPAFLAFSDAQEETPPSGSDPGDKPAQDIAALEVEGLKRLSPDDEVWIDPKAKQVIIGGQVCLDEGPLEMFACPRGTKEYESVVSVNAKSFVVHTALLAIGAKAGHPVKFQPKYESASGSRIAVQVQWKGADGQWLTANAKDWVQDSSTKTSLAEDWVFAGSGFWKDPESGEEFYHAEGGELLCVSNFSTAMMDLPIKSSQRNAQRLYQAFAENVPAIDTRVKLVMSVLPGAGDDETVAQSGAASNESGQLVKIEPGEQIANVFIADNSGQPMEIPYWLFAPRGYEASDAAVAKRSLPLLLFLHGLGESGSGGKDLDRVKIHGPPMLADRDASFPLVVASPQCPHPGEDMQIIKLAWKEDAVVELVDHLVSELNVDPDRVYVTGLSMGGYGTWRLAAKYPDRFAAAVPICGGGLAEYAPALKDMPIWCFHGKLDQVVPLEDSQDMIDAIQAAGGRPKFTIYPDMQHHSWVPAYNDPALFKWLLEQKRNKK